MTQIFSGLLHTFQDAQQRIDAATLRADMAEGERTEIEKLCAEWFLDSDPAAREWLREIALDYRLREQDASGQLSRATREARTTPAEQVPPVKAA